MNNQKGFSLVEMIIVTFIFVVVIMISASAFDKIYSTSSQLTKASHSNVEGIIGLELFRADLDAAGFGLPSSFSNTLDATYTECQVVSTHFAVNGTGVDPVADFNDAGAGIPRAILTKATTGGTSPGSTFLVIKSTPVGSSAAAKKWSYVNYSGPTSAAPTVYQGVLKSYGTASNLQNGDRVITSKMSFSSTGISNRQLIVDGAGAYFYAVGATQIVPDTNFIPGDATETYVAYGVNSGADLSMPFNRADYFVYRPTGTNTMSARCAPGTGNLYKATVAHNGGGYNPLTPLLDCVLDMQVSFLIDVNNDGNISATNTLVGYSAQQIREQVKSIRVQILTHEGGPDRNYTYPNASIFVGPFDSSGVALTSQGKTWTNTEMTAVGVTKWQNYRWKVYEIIVQPKNLNK